MTKFKNPFLPSFDLVVTRHAPLVEWLLREGYIDESTPVASHAHADKLDAQVHYWEGGYEVIQMPSSRLLRRFSGGRTPAAAAEAKAFADAHNAANVRGRHVLGVLPHHLSAQAASITEVQLDWTLEDRAAMTRGDLDVEAVSRAARGLHTYWVCKAAPQAAIGRAFAKAISVATAYTGCHWTRVIQDEHHDAPRVVVGGACEQIAAEVDLWRGWWRPIDGGVGAWRDAWGKERELYKMTPEVAGNRLFASVDEAEKAAALAGIDHPVIERVAPSWADPRLST